MRKLRWCVLTIAAAAAVLNIFIIASAQAQQPDPIHRPYLLDTGLVSRSISFENPTGAPGEGGKEASNLGIGRKGRPAKTIEPGQTVQLCDIEGPGTIRHIWVTCLHDPVALRSFVIRASLPAAQNLSPRQRPARPFRMKHRVRRPSFFPGVFQLC